jgi:hypothetical protein
MMVSISKAQDVRRSAGHWKRKARTLNGDAAENFPTALKPRHGGSWFSTLSWLRFLAPGCSGTH